MTEADLRRAIEANRDKTETAIRSIDVLKAEMEALARTLQEKHEQNRKDIHALRNSIQSLMDEFYKFCNSITESIHRMQLTSARAKGYWLGVGAAATFIMEMGKILVEHIWK